MWSILYYFQFCSDYFCLDYSYTQFSCRRMAHYIPGAEERFLPRGTQIIQINENLSFFKFSLNKSQILGGPGPTHRFRGPCALRTYNYYGIGWSVAKSSLGMWLHKLLCVCILCSNSFFVHIWFYYKYTRYYEGTSSLHEDSCNVHTPGILLGCGKRGTRGKFSRGSGGIK